MIEASTSSAALGPLAVPRVVGAQARDLSRIRVGFDRAVVQRDARDAGDALNRARYLLTPTSAPAVDALVVAVEAETSAAVELLTDIALTPGAGYRVDVVGVGAAGSAGTVGENGSASFLGFLPPRPARRRFDLYRFIPEMNRREDTTGDLQRFFACLQELVDLVLVDVDHFTDILDPDIAGEPFLGRMLGELGDPFAFDLSVVDKRRLLNVLVAMYREKGTERGITNAIRFFLGFEVTITAYAAEAMFLGESLLGVDWVLGPSTSFAALAFEVVSPRILAPEERRRLRHIVNFLKPAQTHFARLVEPTPPAEVDHVELGPSSLSENWVLHA